MDTGQVPCLTYFCKQVRCGTCLMLMILAVVMIMINLVVMLMMALTGTNQEGRVLIAGGSDGFHIRRETYIFQLAAIGSWQRGPDLRQPRFLAC